MKDLVILVADKNMEYAVKGLLSRPEALSIREISFDIFIHPYHDPGCLNEGHYFLQSALNQYRHALILFDREGCGREGLTRQELEIWVWSDSPHVAEILGWKNKQPDLKTWL
ncbi:MAG TPA: hypothetical protein EYP59_12680 [Thiotrichaceae bacterium]|nr:hypothetical protein [Thiotrichaceae bacterium]